MENLYFYQKERENPKALKQKLALQRKHLDKMDSECKDTVELRT